MNIIHFSPNGQNRTPDIVNALLQVQSDTVISFEKGVYDFYKEGAYSDFFTIGCNRNGTKHVIFPILNRKNIVIEGNGSLFLFHDRVFPFIAQHCQNITLKNFQVDFSFPRCLEGEVTRLCEDGFELTIDTESCQYSVNESGNFLIQAGSDLFSTSERRIFLEQKVWHCFLVAGEYYYETDNWPADTIFCNAIKTEKGVFFQYKTKSKKVEFQLGKKLMISYDELRENDVFFFEQNTNTVIQNVHILHGAGMGVVAQACENITLDELIISPNSEEMSSTTADGIMMINITGKLTIQNCRIDRSVDDALCVCGMYMKIEKITAPNKVIARLMHPSQAGVMTYFENDILTVLDGKRINPQGTVTLKSVNFRDDLSIVYLEFYEDIRQSLKAGDYLENADRMPEVDVRNCIFENIPGLRLGSSKKTVFENNIVRNYHGFLINDIMNFWYASGCVKDVLIKENTFENSIGLAAVSIFIDRPVETDMRHKNIKVIANRFVNCKGGINAKDVDGLKISQNIFENVEEEILIENCINCQSSETVCSEKLKA